MIYIQKNNQQLGPYTPDEVQRFLSSGHLSPEDWAIRQDENQWIQLGEIMGVPVQTKANSLAIAGFVVGLFSLIFVGLPMLAAFAFEEVGMKGTDFLISIPLLVFPTASYLLSRSGYHRATNDEYNMGGKRLAIAGIILSGVVFAFLAFLIVRHSIIFI
jgi:hypothetical protein